MSNFETGEDFAGSFLSHFGVRGMKWGRRQDKGNSAVGKSDKGEMSDDAKQAHELSTKVKTSGTKALSNKEMRALVDRMSLEKRFKEINTPAAKKQNPILAGATWTVKKMGTLTGQSVEQVIKANLANEMNVRVKAQLAGRSATAAQTPAAVVTAVAGPGARPSDYY